MSHKKVTRVEPFILQLPLWVTDYLTTAPEEFPTIEQRMAMISELSSLNVQHGTGGPFAAGVFDSQTNRLVAPGVNMVTTAHASMAHAEMVALTFAQQSLGHYDLGADELTGYELVTSSEPCAMCLGAIPWSGVHQLVSGARDEDVRSIGFDEGTKPINWVQDLEARGMTVIRDVGRYQAVQVLQDYVKAGGMIYNGR